MSGEGGWIYGAGVLLFGTVFGFAPTMVLLGACIGWLVVQAGRD